MTKETFDWAAFKEYLFDSKIASTDSLRGCTEEEISALEARCQISLPGIYREFLREMGHAMGSWGGGDYWRYEDLDEIQELARSMSEESTVLPKNFFAFSMDGPACQILFFICDEDPDDPPVYHYMESHEGWTPKDYCFSEMLWLLAKEKADYIKKYG